MGDSIKATVKSDRRKRLPPKAVTFPQCEKGEHRYAPDVGR